MAKVKIQGHASGTGILTVTAPNTSTDRTITLPDTTGTLLDENSSLPAANLTGTVADARISTLTASKLTGALPAISGAALTNVAINGSAFAAYNASNQSIPSGTFTKIEMSTEEFDLNNEYDHQTNYRFTPTVAGYYQINGQFRIGSVSNEFFIALNKNGSGFTRGTNQLYGSTSSIGASILSQVIYLNGSGDYVEMFAYQASGGNLSLAAGRNYLLFQGYFVRGA